MQGTIILCTLGLFVSLISAQILTTKCPTDWTKYKERCYLIPVFSHNWHRANTYCEKYGATLAHPTGYLISDKIISDVTSALPAATSFWIGYYRPDNTVAEYMARFSDGRPTSVEVGVWGQNEPNTAAGQYAFISTQDSKWYMGPSDTVRNFVCEMDPCPTGTRDTYMCNGKCLSTSVRCNGVDDCGNNQDENNCASVSGGDCTREYEGTSGTISLTTTNGGLYQPDVSCSWTIKTSPDKRVHLKFNNFETEPNTDFLELYDGGPTRSTSQLAARLSGSLTNYTFISSYNFVTLRFVSDSSTQYPAGTVTWTTELECGYDKKDGYGYTNTDIEYEATKLPSIKTTDTCKEECDASTSCAGFRYTASERTCYFINKLPVLHMDSSSELWMKICKGGTTVQGGVPLLPMDHVATTSPQQLATPLYPNPYVGNMELKYTITTSGNNLITLEVLYLDLCCNDHIYIYDEDDLLETLSSGSATKLIMSTGNRVHVKMDLLEHWKCNGALIQYKQGCDVSIVGSGTLNSPGYGTSKSYPDLMECYWTLHAPSQDRSVTVVFEDFDLDEDVMTIAPVMGSISSHNGTSLFGQSRTEENRVTLAMFTGSRGSGRGFKASFSPGCPVLNADGYVVSPRAFDFGDRVNLSCADGYAFTGIYSQQTNLTLTCETGGLWSLPNVPSCIQGKCGPAPFITHGYIVSSTGSVGGSVTEYMCNANYTMLGSATILCQADGNWEQRPTCVSTLCDNISNLAPTTNTEVLHLDGFNHGSVVELTCDSDEEIIGAQTVQCKSGMFDFAVGSDPSFCKPVPCETPVIRNAILSPEPEFIQGQEIMVTCVEGYVMKGVANFTCGGSSPLPECQIQNCSLGDFNLIIPTDGSGKMQYTYGEGVNVTCQEGFYLEGIYTSHAVITCLHTGEWSQMLTCGKPNCGVPYAVPGSVYIPSTDSDEFCNLHGCTFTFQCRDKYDMLGSSSLANNTVTCGKVYDGLWDLGDLRCLGGQCPDPGYPASGELVGDSFEEFANVTFRCTQAGFEPLDSTGQVSTGMICMYNETSMQMEWVGEMPECKDTQAPVVANCEGGKVTYRAERLTPLLGVLDPTATDNNNIKSVLHYPENAWFSQPFDEATVITWIFTDFNGNSKSCTVTLVIPASIECKNDQSTEIELTANQNVSIQQYVEMKTGDIRVTYEPESFYIEASAASLNTIYESEVTSLSAGNQILDKCTVQLKFIAPQCAIWAFEIPNGMKVCSGNSCNITCDAGSFFVEDPTLSYILMSCSSTGWDREPPVCGQSTENYLIYEAVYDYKYFIDQPLGNATECITEYRPVIQNMLEQFVLEMEVQCNQFSNNPIDITLQQENTNLNFNLATRRLSVRFELLLTVQDETLPNTLTAKEQCVNVITSRLNTKQNIDSIQFLPNVSGCHSGTYDLLSGTPIFGYDCFGYRRFQPNGRLCLECPLGYYYDSTIEPYDCKKCPAGTYGQVSVDGAICVTCPENKNPGLTGQTDISSCDIKEPCPAGYFSFDGLKPCKACPVGYYSPESYSRDCTPCGTNKVTYSEASTSSIDCKTLNEAIAEDGTTPCTPDNPCMNGGTCGFVRYDYNCTCPPGYTGRRCETVFNLCTSNPCKNGKQCVTTAGSDTFSCTCSTDPAAVSELSGDLCEIDMFGCTESFCNNNGTCHNQFQSYSCKCPTYSGYKNAELRMSGTCSAEINPCEVEPVCQHGVCIPNGHFYKTCDCDPGWTGIYCENNVDDCDPSYCQNGATCIDGINSFICTCADGFHGPYCQFRKACDRKCTGQVDDFCNTCNDDNTQECLNVNDDFMCQCNPGYAGRSCEVATSLCKSFPCQHGGTCTPVNETLFNCSCMHPWTGNMCERQINNCPNGEQCFNGGTCYSTTSGYRCKCPENFIGDDCSVSYDLCTRANPCTASGSDCLFSAGEFQCTCPTGYTGNYCEDKLPSCADNICQNGGTCTDNTFGATCACPEEFTGTTCDMEIDACASNPCQSNQECINDAGKYTCTCAAGLRGQNCDKAVGDNFDYVITPMQLCLDDASMAMFGDGVTNIDAFSIAFWERYTSLHGDGVILSMFGSKTGGNQIPTSPDFQLKFLPTEVAVFVKVTSTRRKRQTEYLDNLDYPASVADGYWHHIAVTWSADKGELTLYIDGQPADAIIFSEKEPAATINGISVGFLVFSDFDPVVGSTDPENSFEGRVSKVYVVGSELTSSMISQLYSRSLQPSDLLLYPERTTMIMYPLDYNSELSINTNKCLPSDTACKTLDAAADAPEVSSCPMDTFIVSERTARPNWTIPVFSGSTTVISNYQTGGSLFDFGVYGISYAGFDTQGDAAVCTFRLFFRDVGCVDEQNCDALVQGGQRCRGTCPTNQALTGSVSLYQTCSMYGMWDEEVKYTRYIFPECAATTDITQKVTLELTAFPSSRSCEDIREDYSAFVLDKLNELNSQHTNNALCGDSCFNVLITAFSCDGNSIKISVDFGILSPVMTYQGESVTTEQLLKIAVGDFGAFDYVDALNRTVSPDLTTFTATVIPECVEGYMVSSGKCVMCGRGTYYDFETKICKRCAVGTYRSDLSNVVSTCTACHQSSTTPTDGATSVDYCIAKCRAGQYYEIPANPSISANQGTCRNCPVGYYQDETSGSVSCKACTVGLTTAGQESTAESACVTPESLTTVATTEAATPRADATTEAAGLGVGVIVAIVLAVLIVLVIIILIICFCCCKELLPCLSKKKQVVSPITKGGYYAEKYGNVDMHFVSYNLQDVREKKGRPLDRVPFVEAPMSDESGSVKTDISVHVPVFEEKIGGKIKRKNLYMSNGGQSLNASTQRSNRTPRDPVMTSSPRDIHYQNEMEGDTYVQPKQKRRRRRNRKDRSSSEKRSHHRYEEESMGPAERYVGGGPLPKALSPMPHRLVSKPPDDVILRPSSPLTQPRVHVEPSQYEDFLNVSPPRERKSHRSPRSSQSRDKERSRSKHRHHSYDDDEMETRQQYSGDYYEEEPPFHIKRIEVESDEDLR